MNRKGYLISACPLLLLIIIMVPFGQQQRAYAWDNQGCDYKGCDNYDQGLDNIGQAIHSIVHLFQQSAQTTNVNVENSPGTSVNIGQSNEQQQSQGPYQSVGCEDQDQCNGPCSGQCGLDCQSNCVGGCDNNCGSSITGCGGCGVDGPYFHHWGYGFHSFRFWHLGSPYGGGPIG